MGKLIRSLPKLSVLLVFLPVAIVMQIMHVDGLPPEVPVAVSQQEAME